MEKLLTRLYDRGWRRHVLVISVIVTSAAWWSIYQLLRSLPFLEHHPLLSLVHPAILVPSILLHEIGHGLALRRLGLRPMLLTFIIGGGAFVPDRIWRPCRSRLSMGQEVSCYLGGVMVNAVVVALASLATLVPSWHTVALVIAYLNGLLIVVNLLPIPGTDGGQFWARAVGRRSLHDGGGFRERLWFGVYSWLIIIGWLGTSYRQFLH